MLVKIKKSLGIKIFIGTIFILTIVSLITYASVRFLMPKAYEQIQNKNISTNINQLVEQLETVPLEEMELLVKQFAVNNLTNITIYDANREPIVSFILNNETSDESLKLSSVIGFMNAGQAYSIITETSMKSIDQLIGTFSYILPYIIIIIMILSAITAFLYARIISRPIVSISDVSNKMTTLDMSWRCTVHRSDEIGILAENLNQMAENLGAALEELTVANQKLKDDIEKERQLEKQRIDFFRAISHELKTPITIFKGELEGMIYSVGEYKDRDKYLRHSMKTVIEMENIVKEILSVSRMSANDFSLTLSKFRIDTHITEYCRRLEGIAEDKKLKFIMNIEPWTYYGDEALLKKAISNIIGNAVMHSPKQANIYVTFINGVLCVENTGVQISNEDMIQLFQPFYRIDRSHNGETGGSGLGLYIVKNILDLHHLSYTIDNSDAGVIFTITFK